MVMLTAAVLVKFSLMSLLKAAVLLVHLIGLPIMLAR